MYINDIPGDMYSTPDGLYWVPNSDCGLIKLKTLGMKCCLKINVKKGWKYLGTIGSVKGCSLGQ